MTSANRSFGFDVLTSLRAVRCGLKEAAKPEIGESTVKKMKVTKATLLWPIASVMTANLSLQVVVYPSWSSFLPINRVHGIIFAF